MSSSIPASTPGKPWQPPAPEDLAPELPQYEILGLLGRGGMGAVYRARQKSLNREVAIKVLPPTIEDADMHYAERFIAEAQSMARLEHSNIIAVYDAGQTPGGLLYFVMQYVQGTDVAQMIQSSGRLPAAHAHAITAHVCEALAYAHKNGLIHRDIKPANIMVDMEGRVKVADFGLAKAVDAQTGFTQSNMAVGTPDFVAPEALIPGMPVDGRADLYAVGVMLYQMLTGNIPRGAWQPASVMAPGTDPRFDQIIVKAMAYDRESRHSSATELRQHLDTLLMPAAPAPDLQRYSSAQMPKQAAPQASKPGVATARPAVGGSAPAGRAAATPGLQPKSKTPLFIGIGAAAMIGIGAFVMFSGGGKAKPSGPHSPLSGASSVADSSNPAQGTVRTTLAPAAALSLQDGFTNSLGMKFVPVPDTQVLFCIHETRYQDYAAYALDAPGVDGGWNDQSADSFTPTENKEQHPVVNVSWEDAQKFCEWLSKKEGKLYRLPTDQEWSCAVGIRRDEKWTKDTTPATVTKSQTDFPWGDQWPPPKGSGNFSDDSRKAEAPNATAQYLENYDDGFPTTAPVMSFEPNKLGLYDLEGNVREWVEDWYDDAKANRVLRGGCWFSGGRAVLLSSRRHHVQPGNRGSDHGFRVVVVVSGG